MVMTCATVNNVESESSDMPDKMYMTLTLDYSDSNNCLCAVGDDPTKYGPGNIHDSIVHKQRVLQIWGTRKPNAPNTNRVYTISNYEPCKVEYELNCNKLTISFYCTEFHAYNAVSKDNFKEVK